LSYHSQVGIPDWVVDIRHGVVHNQLPSQGLILKALHFARQFLIVSIIRYDGMSLCLKMYKRLRRIRFKQSEKTRWAQVELFVLSGQTIVLAN